MLLMPLTGGLLPKLRASVQSATARRSSARRVLLTALLSIYVYGVVYISVY